MFGLMPSRRKLISAVPRMLYDSLGGEAGSTRGMDIATFEDLIDRLGEDLSLWPDDQRLAAVQLLASSAEARTLYEEASALRQALKGPPVRAPAGLVDRIAAAAAKLPQEPQEQEPPGPQQPGAVADEPKAARASDEAVPAGKVLPALLLALWLLPALAPPGLLDEPDAPISFSL
ncbi:hypothetical protein [Bradyrhizobium jicamae]|uniref:hypothetical protein n=1 Tax=Bradyrhizobium jicamae TaxID=280332 RepID=UPI0028964550|nr:hypothetical protein [Bradyrhizobium jicamae]